MSPKPTHLSCALVLCLPLLACGPKVFSGGSDTDDDSSTTAQSTGDGSPTGTVGDSTSGSQPEPGTVSATTGPEPGTVSATTGPEPGTVSATTSASDTTSTSEGSGTDFTTGVFPPPDGVAMVIPMYVRPGLGQPSGLEGLPVWPGGDPNLSCEDQPPPVCNGPPVLGEPVILVNGGVATVADITIGARVGVLVAFDHPDCAIGCGEQTANVFDEIEGGGGGGSLPVEFPCGTESTGIWAALDFGEIVRSGKHEASLRLTDACGNDSEFKKVEFTM
ncbi:hypothetical protein [Nannocystis pusilla]|uniref:hypothetical protein n=1 Tax=Nannocystis pusilla TaxID=889268 RepID=UPI003DA2CCAF